MHYGFSCLYEGLWRGRGASQYAKVRFALYGIVSMLDPLSGPCRCVGFYFLNRVSVAEILEDPFNRYYLCEDAIDSEDRGRENWRFSREGD